MRPTPRRSFGLALAFALLLQLVAPLLPMSAAGNPLPFGLPFAAASSAGVPSTPPKGVYATLVQNADFSYTVTQPDESAWTFDQTGRLTKLADRYGNAAALSYNSSGQLATVSDPAGRGSLAFGYYSGQFNNQLHTITDWTNRVVTYSYDGSNRLSQVTDRTGSATTTYGYDGTSSRLTTITDANNHGAITLGYDAQGRVQTQTDALNNQTTFGYATTNATGPQTATVTGPATSFDGVHPTTVDTYNSLGQLTQRQVTPSASDGTYSESFGYDANGDLTSHWISPGLVDTLRLWDAVVP